MEKIISARQAACKIKDGMTVMVGGFMGCGSPHKIINVLLESGVKDLTIICNDAGYENYGVGHLIVAGRVKKLIASHIGLNKTAGQKMNEGTMDIELVPQGTLAERIRCGGAGLGGVLTPTGIGTIVAEGKQVIRVEGKEYLLETPLKADIALINGFKIDCSGNVFYNGSTRNFNPIMATAADIVIAEADYVVGVGDIDLSAVHTPGIFVDFIVDGGNAA